METEKNPEAQTILAISYAVRGNQEGLCFDNKWAFCTGTMGSTADWLPHGVLTETKFDVTIICDDNLTAISLDVLESCEAAKGPAPDSTTG